MLWVKESLLRSFLFVKIAGKEHSSVILRLLFWVKLSTRYIHQESSGLSSGQQEDGSVSQWEWRGLWDTQLFRFSWNPNPTKNWWSVWSGRWERRNEYNDMDVSENRGTPKSSILIGFSIINHPFWGTPILETPYIGNSMKCISTRCSFFLVFSDQRVEYVNGAYWDIFRTPRYLCHLV